MPRPLLVFLSLALGAMCAFALAACGSDEDGTIPPQNAEAMLAALDDAQGEQETRDCAGLADAAGNLQSEVDGLPDGVDPEVRTALAEGAQNLQDLANDESKCEPAGPTGPSGQQQEETPTETVAPTTTTEETTTETTTTETQEESGGPNGGPPPGAGPPEQPPGEGGGGLGQGDEGGEPPTGGTGEE
jgi:hypothetical protein